MPRTLLAVSEIPAYEANLHQIASSFCFQLLHSQFIRRRKYVHISYEMGVPYLLYRYTESINSP
jgi:hypothetical protein